MKTVYLLGQRNFCLFISFYLLLNEFLQSEIMQKSHSVQNITSIIAVADEKSDAFVCLWCCAPPCFVVQINDFFSLVPFSAVIHKRRGKKLIIKTIKYKRDSFSKMQFAFCYLKDIPKVFGKLSILSKIWK